MESVEEAIARVCTVCAKSEEESAFRHSNTVCHRCSNALVRERHAVERMAEDPTSTKTCVGVCGLTKLASEFEPHRKKCYSCRDVERKNRAKESAEGEVIPTKPCTVCGKTYWENADGTNNLDEFRYRQQYRKFATMCKSCESNKGHWKTWREKQRAENEEEFLRHNASTMIEWRQKNSEHVANYRRERAKQVEVKMSSCRRGAKAKNIHFEEADAEQLAEKLTQACCYCGIEPSEKNGELNGLDRVDNTGGYTDENTVPACSTCNFAKGTMSAAMFQSMCVRVTQHLIRFNDEVGIEASELDALLTPLAENEEVVFTNKTAHRNLAISQPDKVNKARKRHQYIDTGKAVVFYHKDTLEIGCRVGSKVEAGNLIHIKTPINKLKNPDILWVNNVWKARLATISDEVTAAELFQQDLEQHNKRVRQCVKPQLCVKDIASGNVVFTSTFEEMSKLTNIPPGELKSMFRRAEYSKQNVEFSQTDELGNPVKILYSELF